MVRCCFVLSCALVDMDALSVGCLLLVGRGSLFCCLDFDLTLFV